MGASRSSDPNSWSVLPALGPKEHAFVPEQISHALQQEIAEGRISPGTKLPEVLIAEAMQVSRHTIRAAFKLLEEEGLAKRAPNRGVFVISPSVAELRELYRIRRIIEPGVIRTVPLDAVALDRLTSIAQDAEPSHLGALAKANQDFHRCIIDQAHSPLLSRTMGRILAQMRLAFSHHDIATYREFREKHFSILHLIRDGDAEGAAQQLDDYLQDSEFRSIAALERDSYRSKGP